MLGLPRSPFPNQNCSQPPLRLSPLLHSMTLCPRWRCPRSSSPSSTALFEVDCSFSSPQDHRPDSPLFHFNCKGSKRINGPFYDFLWFMLSFFSLSHLTYLLPFYPLGIIRNLRFSRLIPPLFSPLYHLLHDLLFPPSTFGPASLTFRFPLPSRIESLPTWKDRLQCSSRKMDFGAPLFPLTTLPRSVTSILFFLKTAIGDSFPPPPCLVFPQPRRFLFFEGSA